MKHLLLICLLSFQLDLVAQFVAPPASPPAEAKVDIGYTTVSVNYHRPNVRGRKIFGELIPWNEVWRAGANENTLLTLGGEAYIGNTLIPAGTYSVYLVPSEFDEWTWILNQETENWGTRGYNQNEDLIRVHVKAEDLPSREESLGYRFRNVGPDGAELSLEWEWKRVSLRIVPMTSAEVLRRAEQHLNPAKDPKEYYAAARYFLDNDIQLEEAKAFIDRWAAEDEEQFGRMRYQAIIESRLGNTDAAQKIMGRSLELAREAGNEHYVRMNEKSLRDWSREVVEIPADSLLARSIRYHDPEGNWPSSSLRLMIAESRPGGSIRHSRLTLYPTSNDFDLQQTRGKDRIQIRYLNGTYSFGHQGRTEIDKRDAERLNLTPERTNFMRDYYTYLYGLPMKLRDPGTLVDPIVHKVWFQDQEVLELKVRYAPEAGKDIWSFYMDPETYALKGYSFYHKKDGPGQGEYIILKEEALVDKMRLPAERHWYYTHNNLYLGTDEILR